MAKVGMLNDAELKGRTPRSLQKLAYLDVKDLYLFAYLLLAIQTLPIKKRGFKNLGYIKSGFGGLFHFDYQIIIPRNHPQSFSFSTSISAGISFR